MSRYADQERFQRPLPELAQTEAFGFIEEDESGRYWLTVRVSGDLETANTVIVRPMPWSDHPCRGFEAFRERVIAAASPRLAVIGVSFPGMGGYESGPTPKQREALERDGFGEIAVSQWKAIWSVFKQKGFNFADKELILAGDSMAASNIVGMLEHLPVAARVRDIALIEGCGFEERRASRLGWDFFRTGPTGQADYLKRNPRVDFDAYGYPSSLAKLGRQVMRQPYTHLRGPIRAMAVGRDAERLARAYHDNKLEATVHLWTGGESVVAKPRFQAAARAVIGLAVKEIDYQVHPGEHHSARDFLGLAVGQHREIVLG